MCSISGNPPNNTVQVFCITKKAHGGIAIANQLIPKVSCLRGLLEAREMIANPVQTLEKHRQALGATFWYPFGGVTNALITTDPTLAKHVLKTNHANYHKSQIQTKIMVEFLGRGLLTDQWEEWQPKRQKLAKAFQPPVLEGLASTIENSAAEAMQSFDERMITGPVSLKEEITTITFAMAARTFFGMSFPLENIKSLSSTIKSVQHFMTKLVVLPFLRPWWHLTGEMNRQQNARRRGDSLLMEHISNHPKEFQDKATNLLGLLLDMTGPEFPEHFRLSMDQVLAEAMQILVAGHETSSNAFVWIMLLLNSDPAAKAIVADEFSRVTGNRTPKFSDISKLSKTDEIIEESLRLFPPFWMIDRVALVDDVAAGIKIPCGSTIIFFLYGMHRDPSLWTDPGHFQPERFNSGLHQHRDFYHMPFGAGPRRCIGMNFDKLQLMILLQKFITQYEIDFVESGFPKIHAKFMLSPAGPVLARVSRRCA